ncbi:hypothetical protein G3N59_05510 [Paraburkholderia sp. Ac-20340]|uniref:hypothetical protein n=1 Tax=Paraburkholderia sp. Ac-20340 TaxID=2703888 RepID=UPI00197D6F51|nr:hypothetical protein [Paraburkholderia sp. Ac-20340]MBN3852832.1 hypothetical protein [Paraburkholderia sp. Ac-20340]
MRPMTKDKTVHRMNLDMPPEMFAEVRAHCEAVDLTFSQYVRRLIRADKARGTFGQIDAPAAAPQAPTTEQKARYEYI